MAAKSITQFAKELGVSRQYVSRMVQALPVNLKPGKQGTSKLLSDAAQKEIRNQLLSSYPHRERSQEKAAVAEQDQIAKLKARIAELEQSGAKKDRLLLDQSKQISKFANVLSAQSELLTQLPAPQSATDGPQGDSEAEADDDTGKGGKSAQADSGAADGTPEDHQLEGVKLDPHLLSFRERVRALFTGRIN